MRIGVDLMRVSRFTRIAAHERYRAVLFTQAELDQAAGLGAERYVERLAGRFAAKEATCKMLGRGFGQGLRWRDIEVTGDRWGAPSVRLSGGALGIAERLGLAEVALSVTHQAGLVVAVAAGVEAPAARPESIHPSIAQRSSS
jgi:holo-[acyl-carrier protein] synthase